jgi:ATP-dependent helicase HrpB
VLLTEQGLGGRDADARHRLSNLERESSPRAKAAKALADRIARLAGVKDESMDLEDAGLVLARGFPERLAKARGANSGDFLMANGRAASIDSADPLAREDFLVVADLTGRAGKASIRFAAPLLEKDVERLFGDRIETIERAGFDKATGALRASRMRRLGRITLSEAPLERPSDDQTTAAILELVAGESVSVLPWNDEALLLRSRVDFLRKLALGEWPDFSDEALQSDAANWLAPVLTGVRRLSDLADGRLQRALENQLTFQQKRDLAALAPATLKTPAGGEPTIDYAAEGGPAVAVRLQEMFGLAEHPRVGGAKVPLVITLLSPAQRPIQTTADLPGFWRGSYAGVRADMRGRYPKHPWPEDPLNAEPTRRAKPRGT